jgi:hypothetical protein
MVMAAEGDVGPFVEIAPADELELLNRMPPCVEEPASVWLAWHERHMTCWERIAESHPFMEDAATYMIDGHRLDVARLLIDPDSRRARHGYWDLWPGMTG